MKKSIIISGIAILMLTACNGNKSQENKTENAQEVQPIENEVPKDNSIEEQEAKEARRLDSLNQVKAHGHAH
jgi:outer membrane biogenesis lipoprotein LolB|uniref:hypothetical protein n=1 Tax=Roseivirga sp. TaxID=1964215 RepID=UPI0040482C5F